MSTMAANGGKGPGDSSQRSSERRQVRTFFEASRRRYGSPRILRDLDDAGERVSRKRVVRLMQGRGWSRESASASSGPR